MFEFGREIRRALSPAAAPPRDGLTGGDPALLELLDLPMLRSEARAADIAAGRIGEKNRPLKQLQSALVWRELARRSGDPVALRKAAAQAEASSKGFAEAKRPAAAARAEVEQALTALVGAELFADDGLEAAVRFRLERHSQAEGPAGALAQLGLAALAARQALAAGKMDAALAAAENFDRPLATLTRMAPSSDGLRLAAVEHRAALADVLAACGARLKDRRLLDCALRELETAQSRLKPLHEPLLSARLIVLAGGVTALIAEMTADAALAADAVESLTGALEAIDRDQSPLDWVRAQTTLAQALQTLGEVTDCPRAFDQALRCLDRAHVVLKGEPALALRALVANSRAACLGRLAELTGDLAVLDAAEAALKSELTALDARRDPLAWAAAQLGLARLYELRVEITGRGQERLSCAATAYAEALEVFAEQGLRSMSDLAARGLERIRAR